MDGISDFMFQTIVDAIHQINTKQNKWAQEEDIFNYVTTNYKLCMSCCDLHTTIYSVLQIAKEWGYVQEQNFSYWLNVNNAALAQVSQEVKMSKTNSNPNSSLPTQTLGQSGRNSKPFTQQMFSDQQAAFQSSQYRKPSTSKYTPLSQPLAQDSQYSRLAAPHYPPNSQQVSQESNYNKPLSYSSSSRQVSSTQSTTNSQLAKRQPKPPRRPILKRSLTPGQQVEQQVIIADMRGNPRVTAYYKRKSPGISKTSTKSSYNVPYNTSSNESWSSSSTRSSISSECQTLERIADCRKPIMHRKKWPPPLARCPQRKRTPYTRKPNSLKPYLVPPPSKWPSTWMTVPNRNMALKRIPNLCRKRIGLAMVRSPIGLPVAKKCLPLRRKIENKKQTFLRKTA